VTAHKDEAEKLFGQAIAYYNAVAKAVTYSVGGELDPDGEEWVRVTNAKFKAALASFRLALIYPKGARFNARSEDAEEVLDTFLNEHYESLYGAFSMLYLGQLKYQQAVRNGEAEFGEDALNYFETLYGVVTEDPQYPQTIEVLGKAFYWYGKTGNALARAEGALKKKDPTRLGDVLKMGRVLKQKMRYGANSRPALLAHLEVADAMAAQGQFEGAVGLAGEVLAKARAEGAASVVSVATGKLTDWVANVGGAGNLPPGLLAQIGDSLAAQGVTAKAITFYERAVAASKTEEEIEQVANEAWRKIATAYRRDKRYFAAGRIAWSVVEAFIASKQGQETAFYQTASEACWQAVQAYKVIAESAKRAGDKAQYEKVLNTFRSSFPDHPQNADAAFGEALDSFVKANYEEAAGKFKAISTASPSYWSAQMRVPICFIRLATDKDAAESKKWYAASLKAAEELHAIGSKRSDLPQAQAAMRAGMMLQAISLHALERWEEALKSVDAFMAAYPGVYPGKGREFKIKIDALVALGRLDEAEAALARFKTKLKGSSYLKGSNLQIYKALREKYKPLGGRERANLAKRAALLWEQHVDAKGKPTASDFWFLADVLKDAQRYADAASAYESAANAADTPGQREGWTLLAAEMGFKAARENRDKMDPAEYRKVLAQTRERFTTVLFPDPQQRKELLQILADGKKWPSKAQWKWLAAKPEPLLTAAEVYGESSPQGLDGRWIGVRLLDKLHKITEPAAEAGSKKAEYVNTWWEGAQLKLELYLAIAEAQNVAAGSKKAAQYGFSFGKRVQVQYEAMDGPERVAT
ncbi:MAG: tetratricopeptide repeat protein, partial [Planctomycetota bacterium]